VEWDVVPPRTTQLRTFTLSGDGIVVHTPESFFDFPAGISPRDHSAHHVFQLEVKDTDPAEPIAESRIKTAPWTQ